MKKKFIIPVILIAVSTAGYTISSTRVGGVPDTGIEVAPKRYVSAEGKVESLPGFDVKVASELTGRIEKFFLKEGDWVIEGGLIARLDNRDIQAKLREAERELAVARARLAEAASGARVEEIKRAEASYEAARAEMELAKKNLERTRLLYRQEMIPKATLDERERDFFIADARVREALEEKTLLENGPKKETLKLHEDMVAKAEATVEYYKEVQDKSTIKSPIAGKVIRKFLEEGEMASPENPLVAVANVEKTRINAEVDETDIGRINIGDTAEVICDAYPGRVLKGTVSEISDYAGHRRIKPSSDAKNLDMKIVQVKIELNEKSLLKLGMSVDVRISIGE
ncbi:MAG: HlyD family secretion protein [Nitrospirae bacterium]|nr:HlyD family secretion protein [Nitrospirota bacterium]